ncbi:hypothetical protein [Niabella drilacis]|uniref:Acetyltransferase (GNAT) family protein n=1 Tax=Niabella drilacis (strain DSM 25811 / CCM 8410 / CCUG 62505 / LMG 26954 / E90) TaxID=1285928 RepID=A0A1G6U1S3_NIADE|nr:hypothetical protein [Niabella drilacis]SDD35144.1 hypothetical protein SAMN04487894_108111 [Niabella drilacis]
MGQLIYEKAMQVTRDNQAGYVYAGRRKKYQHYAFYQKNGFTVFDKHLCKQGNGEQTDITMQKLLEPV